MDNLVWGIPFLLFVLLCPLMMVGMAAFMWFGTRLGFRRSGWGPARPTRKVYPYGDDTRREGHRPRPRLRHGYRPCHGGGQGDLGRGHHLLLRQELRRGVGGDPVP